MNHLILQNSLKTKTTKTEPAVEKSAAAGKEKVQITQSEKTQTNKQ